MKQRIKSYKFWVALSASVILLLKTLGQAFNFEIDGEIVNAIIMAFCGVLVVLDIVEKPTATAEEKSENEESETKNNEDDKTENK